MKKNIITLSKPLSLFLKDGILISDDQAREIWDGGGADWSHAAYQLMAAKVMGMKTAEEPDSLVNDLIEIVVKLAQYGEVLWDEENFRDGYKKVDSGLLVDARAVLDKHRIGYHKDEE